jgi:RNA polymerase sigma-70 factor (ECF subfamily)
LTTDDARRRGKGKHPRETIRRTGPAACRLVNRRPAVQAAGDPPIPVSIPPSTNPSGERDPRAFATSNWSMIAHAGDAATPNGRAALAQLCRVYWYPLYWFSRSRGLSQHDAEDLIQGFFEDIIERGAIAKADAARGRFRTFLLSSLRNFHSHQRARAGRLKRGGGQEILSLDKVDAAETRFRNEPATEISPEKLFDQKWALSLLEAALDHLRHEYDAAGKRAWFDELKVVLWGGRGEVSYAEIALRLESTEGAVKVAVHRLRQRFKEYLRTEVARTVLHPGEIEDEMRHLLAAVSL